MEWDLLKRYHINYISPLNPSDHCVVELSLGYDVYTGTKCNVQFTKGKLAWHKAKDIEIQRYKSELDALLGQCTLANEIMQCTDVNCTREAHRLGIEVFCNTIIDACLEAGRTCIPECKPAGHSKPGWNAEVKELREDSLFWHRLWVDIGRPQTGVVATVMRNTRYKYHKAVKDIKKNDLNVRKAKLAEKANESDGRSLWDELKRLNRGVKCATSTLDGHSTNADIVEHLATKYRALFSSQTTTEARLNDIRHVIQDQVTCEGNAFVVTVTEVCGMTSKLKINKSDGLTGSSSDHFVYAPHRFAVLFTMLINVMLVHGYMPDDMLASVLVPIPKDPRASLTNSGNYRAIALYSSMGKIVDMLISDRYSNQLMTSNAQFAFKKCHSTSMCTALVKEVVSYYNGRNTNVYACLLDATKAFDCVRYDKLFELLLKKDIPGTVIRLLLDSYTRQYAYMRWNNCMSTPIKMENGVKQGGVLSPTLFCIYFDELLRRLRETDVGCHVGHMSYAAFGYADDLLLLSPSIHGLEILVKTSESFASEYGVTFNAKKTECICFSKNACPLQRQVKVNGQHVKWKVKVKYLGIILTNDMCDDADIRAKRGEFIGSVNRLNAQFRVVPDQIRIRLLQTYCTAWYGCQTWLLNTTSVKGMNIEWKKAVRRTLNLPRTTRSKLVPLLAGNHSFQEQHERRWGALYVRMMHSENILVQYMARRSMYNVVGTLGTNRVVLRYKFGMPTNNCVFNCLYMTCEEDIHRANMIRELLQARDGQLDISMSPCEVRTLLEYVCTM